MTATLSLTAWAHEALSDVDLAAIARRAVDLHCRVVVMRSRGDWTIRIRSWAQDEARTPIHQYDSHHLKGNLAQHLYACLAQYERRFVFSADELAVIQHQAGAA